VEVVIGACRSLGARLPAAACRDHIAAMGQELFAPPNVKGWDGERKWIHAGTWAARQDFGRRVGEMVSGTDFGAHLDVAALVPAEVNDPKKVAELLSERVLEGALLKKQRAEVAEYLIAGDDGPKAEEFRKDAEFRTQKIREAVGVLLSLAEYHAY
jgi:hypothetical protein